jgi:hypothetical protein
MTREEWHKWKKSVDQSYVIPSKEEDERMQLDQEEDERMKIDQEIKAKQEREDQRQREFAAFYNHT